MNMPPVEMWYLGAEVWRKPFSLSKAELKLAPCLGSFLTARALSLWLPPVLTIYLCCALYSCSP